MSAETKIESPSAAAAPGFKEFMAASVFPVPFNYPLAGFDRPWNQLMLKTPRALPTFVWDPELISTMVMFWFSGETSLKLIGHTGTGKSEAVMNFHAALNLPLIMLVANPQLASRDLIGGFFPSPSGPVWRDGPVTMAARLGLSVLIDEYNVLDAGEATGLNAFLEGHPFTIPETGETLVPVKGFRVFVTINPKTSGYAGRQTQDLANDDRFVDAFTKYPEPDVEIKAVTQYLVAARTNPDEAEHIAKAVVAGAGAIRRAYMGENDGAGALPCTLSMRGTMRLAKWTVMYSKVYQSVEPPQAPLYMALDTVLANRQKAEVKTAVREAFRLATGIQFGTSQS